MAAQSTPAQPEHGDYDTDAPEDVQPDYQADELDETEGGEQA